VSKAIVIIYSKPGCCLCDEAKETIMNAGCSEEFQLQEINIEDDPALFQQYKYEIPVVFINGVKAFKYRLTASEFRRKLRRLNKT